ncbi:MAG TPA: L-serine ammonia-lyase, iron-sulfur-dependent subunit beta [Anaerovoracaceae bacterium]|jgi:L-serine dehydratase|nr:L-serine ammonia-lyase, iron-sulfur-dependent subunit beta [Eubacteriales bacterium]MDD3289921.1 L-serine ammonia-lyase, iron-sulfur-dependent subunit beta [Eubacteriales bacterium]MDD3864590.1 L-serine ammonia-lyase, iron-sulfur-dependent subunit beta [Eubacteriales bacterium]HPF19467.1 L-serine ammonia-lyase, iron-sulfur-dependent subunit beta [Bacillota bacterium]HRV33216.1 L-serine ammonia-lyase, iron-sulfur-dependent subunit beta [Anaerovoracaceae bacterium]
MKKVNSLFDIIGPIMIGPSSSHTAGAAKLARIAGAFAGGEVVSAEFHLHGSFRETFRGHGTDRALVAGILGLDPHDTRLRTSFALAEEKGLSYEFIPADLGMVHPNTVRFVLKTRTGQTTEVTGSSVGGGEVVITEVNGFEVRFSGNYNTLITRHKDVEGVVAAVAGILAENHINIATLNLSRTHKGQEASMIIETDSFLAEEALTQIRKLPAMISLMNIQPVKVGEIDV